MGLFGKKEVKEEKSKEEVKTSAEMIISKQLEDDDKEAARLVNSLKEGHPLVLNFQKLDTMAANKYIAFFSGAVWALGGKYVRLRETTYLFALKEHFEDGTLNNVIKSIAN